VCERKTRNGPSARKTLAVATLTWAYFQGGGRGGGTEQTSWLLFLKYLDALEE